MKGYFEFIDKDYRLSVVQDSQDIPADALEIVKFFVPPIPPPHTQQDHDDWKAVGVEFNRVKQMIYGAK